MCDEHEGEEILDQIQNWCNDVGEYELQQRVAYVPEDVLRSILFETPEKAKRILDEAGY